MSKTASGMAVGAGLGLLDGLSAWMSAEARPMMFAIVAGSTIKGVLTGLVAGFVAARRQSLLLGVGIGVVVGFVLSSLAAQGQSGHYWEIVLPGMLVGALTGFITQRYPRVLQAGGSRAQSLALIALSLPVILGASSQSAPGDSLSALEFLIGRWEGTSEGQPGTGTVQREYVRVLSSRFIREQNRSVYPAQPKNPKGEIHEHISFFSFDRSRKRIVFRQFHQEGFVNQYVEDAGSETGKIVFTTEAIENIPAGFRARETYVIHGTDEFEEIFELAEPGQAFQLYSRARLRRVK